ncbi:MAG: glycine cleavage system aminomethyltransferase GcvT [Bdellovibrionaceae bacterium]|nr:glycine cleavage system aminomethyltransferase GcvT [Pseudobdellovibrionaceae bacterium]
MTTEVKRTPLYEAHVAMGAKMVEFAGWQMPIQYEGLKEEHLCVRSKVGIFDVSHMGEIEVKGPKALESIEWFTTNSASKLKAGQAQYSLFPNDKGGIVDDLIVYCITPGTHYLLCVNASNTDKDFDYVTKNNKGAEITNVSSQWGQLAIQGPKAIALASKVLDMDCNAIPTFNFATANYDGKTCYVARTGYTGEDGVEVFVPWSSTEKLWKDCFAQSNGDLKAIGLGARDTLRTEKKYSLYGQEITDATNPYEAGLGWVVKPQEKDFFGKAVMMAQKEAGLKRKLVGLEVLGRGIARQGYKVFSFDNKETGEVTSGTLSPSLNKAVAVAYVHPDAAKLGTNVFVEIHRKMVEAKVVATPFV